MEITEAFLRDALEALKAEVLESLHCCMPGNILAYDPETGAAAVQPALRRKTASGEILTAPELQAVPVLRPSEAHIPQPGDPCLLLFMDFCLDGWLESGQPVLPSSPRRHDWSDAIAITGFFPASRR